MTSDKLLYPEEAAAILAITTKQLKLLTDEGLLRWINVGLGKKRPARRYQLVDIEEFKAERARKCQSTKRTVERHTPSISGYKVVDFRGTLEQRQSERRSASKRDGARLRD